MHLRHAHRLCILLLPLLLSLTLQGGISLRHQHRINSWYDQKDPIHQFCTDRFPFAKVELHRGGPASHPPPALPAETAHLLAPLTAFEVGDRTLGPRFDSTYTIPYSNRAPPSI